jgi:soluble lytic murein transglycosylase-like protein
MMVAEAIVACEREPHWFHFCPTVMGLCARALPLAVLFVMFLTSDVQANTSKNPAETQLAAAFELPKLPTKVPGLPSLTGPSADWRQFDSFLTFVVKRVGEYVPGNLKDSLADAFLDSRYELTSAIAPGKGGNPVPQLFSNGWKRLSPIMNKSLPALPKQTASLYSSFIAAADKLAATGAAKLNLTPDALKAMARMIAPSSTADPLAYSTNVDSALRSLLGFGPSMAVPGRQSRLDRRFSSPDGAAASIISFWLDRAAMAAEPATRDLNQMLPDPKDLQQYLTAVRSLLVNLSDKIATKSKLADRYKPVYRQIVFTTAWQESCWRQYIKKGTPLTSETGDLGLMQVNRHTWRGVYDLKGLGGDIEYNGIAGGEILDYYLTRHAIKKGEDKRGGNLARATYSAYNGGPGALARYRGLRQSPTWKKVDEAFWEKFQTVSSGNELAVKSCYEK